MTFLATMLTKQQQVSQLGCCKYSISIALDYHTQKTLPVKWLEYIHWCSNKVDTSRLYLLCIRHSSTDEQVEISQNQSATWAPK